MQLRGEAFWGKKITKTLSEEQEKRTPHILITFLCTVKMKPINPFEKHLVTSFSMTKYRTDKTERLPVNTVKIIYVNVKYEM